MTNTTYVRVRPDQSLSMRGLPRKSWDHSNDLFLRYIGDYGYNIAIIRGGEDFGTHPIHLSDAEVTIKALGAYDQDLSDLTLDVMYPGGDISGNGYPSLLMREVAGAATNYYYLAYTLGPAADDKADFFYSPQFTYTEGSVVSIKCNNDSLDDLLFGFSGCPIRIRIVILLAH